MPVGYEEVTEKVDIDDGALLARLGWMWKPTSRWSLGAALSTESVRLHGSGVRASRLIDALHKDDEESDRYLEAVQRGRARSRYPWSLALGASNGVEGRWRIAMNLNLYLPVAYTRISFTQSPLERGVSSSFTPRITRELTVNTSVGGEFYIGERWPLRAGFFTNHSSAPEIVNAVVAEPQLPHVDLYGAALSLGYKGDNSSINFGVELQLGKGRETTLNSDLEFAAQNPYSRRVRERSRVLFFISGAVSFVSERASKIIKEDKADPETAKEPDDLEEEAQPSP
jgi:long-subunit fatty acid transport protein